MKPLPIQWKFALWSALVTAFAVIVFAIGTLVNLNYEQLEAIDLELQAEAEALGQRPSSTFGDTPPAEIEFHPWMAYAIFEPDGTPSHVSPQLDEAGARLAGKTSTAINHKSPLGHWRMRAMTGNRGQTVIVAYNLAEMHETTAHLLLWYGVSLPLVLIVAALGGRWVAQRALRPVRELAQATTTIRPDRLAVRVPEPPANDELQQLARAFNVMMGRLETSFTQTQRFAADASHELRTPLTIMRNEIEQLLRLTIGTAVSEDRLLSLQMEVSRLDRITEHLLLLARFDAGQMRPTHAEVDFSSLVTEAAADAELIATAQNVSLRCQVARGIPVASDDLMLRRLVLNLLDNAIRHNDDRGCVECTLTQAEANAILRVKNTGPGIPESARADMFQRFYRADPARSRGGHGLGLALCREIARSHGGEVRYAATQDGWTEFVLNLPARPA